MKTNVADSSVETYYEHLVATGELSCRQRQVLQIMVALGGGWVSRRQISDASFRIVGEHLENGNVSGRVNALVTAGLVETDPSITACPISGKPVHLVRLARKAEQVAA